MCGPGSRTLESSARMSGMSREELFSPGKNTSEPSRGLLTSYYVSCFLNHELFFTLFREHVYPPYVMTNSGSRQLALKTQ